VALFDKIGLFGAVVKPSESGDKGDDGDDEVFGAAKKNADDCGSGTKGSGKDPQTSGEPGKGTGKGHPGGHGSGSHGSHGSGGSHGTGVPCFTAGTRIDTARGPIPVEDLRPGDRIVTLDHGLQPVLWAGSVRVTATGALAPIVIAPDTFGPGQPDRPLAVSRQHRMLCRGWPVTLWFGADEVLAPAGGLVNGTAIRSVPGPDPVTYHHLLFATHEILRANGCWCESLLPRDMALSALSPAARDGIRAALGHDGTRMRAARPCLGASAARVLAETLHPARRVGRARKAA
jgi:hypothetical protein